jgi:hypothetical protein
MLWGNLSVIDRRVHWSRFLKNTRQLVFDALKSTSPSNDIKEKGIQILLSKYSVAENLLLYQSTDKENEIGLESAGRAIATILAFAFFAGERNPAAFKNWEKEQFRSRAEKARTRKLPPHLLDGIVVEVMEDPSLPAVEIATATKPRRELMRLAERRRDAINARIAAERKRYKLPTDEPYYADPDSIYRRYRGAKKRTAI